LPVFDKLDSTDCILLFS